jgi:hypothetical protein
MSGPMSSPDWNNVEESWTVSGLLERNRTTQRLFLGSLSTRFQIITQCALNGSYDSNPVFAAEPSLKLITAVTKMNERFANDFWKRGHKRHISPVWSDEEETGYDQGKITNTFFPEDYVDRYPELCGIVEMEDYECGKPIAYIEDPIMDDIERVYQENRGPELGTVSILRLLLNLTH